MLRDLVGEMQRQSGAAAEPDDVDDGIAFGDEELELLVRFRHATAAAGAGRAAENGAGDAPACADALVVEILPVVGVAKLHDVRVLAGVDVIAIAGAVECVEHFSLQGGGLSPDPESGPECSRERGRTKGA